MSTCHHLTITPLPRNSSLLVELLRLLVELQCRPGMVLWIVSTTWNGLRGHWPTAMYASVLLNRSFQRRWLPLRLVSFSVPMLLLTSSFITSLQVNALARQSILYFLHFAVNGHWLVFGSNPLGVEVASSKLPLVLSTAAGWLSPPVISMMMRKSLMMIAWLTAVESGK